MSTREKKLKPSEIASAFKEAELGAVISPKELAEALGLSVKTVYHWIAAGRLNGTFRKRGKHQLLWRNRVIERIFNGPEWQ